MLIRSPIVAGHEIRVPDTGGRQRIELARLFVSRERCVKQSAVSESLNKGREQFGVVLVAMGPPDQTHHRLLRSSEIDFQPRVLMMR